MNKNQTHWDIWWQMSREKNWWIFDPDTRPRIGYLNNISQDTIFLDKSLSVWFHCSGIVWIDQLNDLMKEFVSLRPVAMEKWKIDFLVIIAMVATKKIL